MPGGQEVEFHDDFDLMKFDLMIISRMTVIYFQIRLNVFQCKENYIIVFVTLYENILHYYCFVKYHKTFFTISYFLGRRNICRESE